jgi:hypothetical protein
MPGKQTQNPATSHAHQQRLQHAPQPLTISASPPKLTITTFNQVPFLPGILPELHRCRQDDVDSQTPGQALFETPGCLRHLEPLRTGMAAAIHALNAGHQQQAQSIGDQLYEMRSACIMSGIFFQCRQDDVDSQTPGQALFETPGCLRYLEPLRTGMAVAIHALNAGHQQQAQSIGDQLYEVRSACIMSGIFFPLCGKTVHISDRDQLRWDLDKNN